MYSVGQQAQKKRNLLFNKLRFISCGGSTRTNDLQVMSLASYQLLHSAVIFLFASAKVGTFRQTAKLFGENLQDGRHF